MTLSPAHPPVRQRRARRPSIEDRLLPAMERLFEQGQNFATITVEELAREAGVARATFYLHFKNKGELVAPRMGLLTQGVVGSASAWFDPKGRSGAQTVMQALTGIVTTFHKRHVILAAVATTTGHD